LPQAHDNPEIKAAYAIAKAGGGYEKVERTDADGNKRMDVAYAISNPAEYFAESTEAYFTRNDFFPYTRKELEKHDPGMAVLIEKLWGVK
jgi:Mlc titration factor MtfA (ptsG expression regulator)